MFYQNIFVIFFALCVLITAEELYSNKYDYIDVDAILANSRQRESYYKCFSGAGPCVTADAKFFKDKLPEALVTNCKKCTPKQAENFDKITVWYTTHEPEKYNAIIANSVKKSMRKV